MKVSFESRGNFDNFNKWLKNLDRLKSSEITKIIPKEGVSRLKANTPKDTGGTANGWYSEVTVRKNVLEISWKNRANPDEDVNIAKLIELGHGTKNGGYVPPRPYIKTSMNELFNKASDLLTKELNK